MDDKQFLETLLKRETAEPENIDLLIKLGRIYFVPFYEIKQALFYLDKALTLDPKNTEGRFWVAKCMYHYYCDFARAKTVLEEALAINPILPECLSLLASVLGDLDEPIEQRIKLLNEAVRLAPDWTSPRRSLALLLIKKGQLSEAERLLLDGLELLKPQETIHDPLDAYYESAVTGRNSPDIRMKFESLIEKSREK